MKPSVRSAAHLRVEWLPEMPWNRCPSFVECARWHSRSSATTCVNVTITFAAEAGQLQLNAYEPIIAYSLFRSIAHLEAACRTLEIRGITANRETLRASVENSIGLVTAPTPYIGYEAATKVALEAFQSGRGVYELVLEGGLMTKDHLDRVLHPDALTRPQLRM
jgi:aspartate ammonia-lyase